MSQPPCTRQRSTASDHGLILDGAKHCLGLVKATVSHRNLPKFWHLLVWYMTSFWVCWCNLTSFNLIWKWVNHPVQTEVNSLRSWSQFKWGKTVPGQGKTKSPTFFFKFLYTTITWFITYNFKNHSFEKFYYLFILFWCNINLKD